MSVLLNLMTQVGQPTADIAKPLALKRFFLSFSLHLLRVFMWLRRAVSGLVNLHLSVALFRNCLVFGCASDCCLTSEPQRVSIKSMT